jgi:NTP pyrophosphatase (non-canonical NTP hydrolase)
LTLLHSTEHLEYNYNMKSLLKKIIEFREERDWKQFHFPKNLAISLVLEATEVLELFQWTKNNELPKDKKEALKKELADVYYWLLLLSHDCDVDLDKALEEKMKENAKKYPIAKSKGKSTKYTEL